MIRRPPRSTQGVSSAASDVYKRQLLENSAGELIIDKQKVMQEATERALKTKALFDKKQQEK